MGRRSKRRLTEAECRAACAALGPSTQREDVAHRVLVQGTTQVEVAAAYGLSRQRIGHIVTEVWEEALRQRGRPADWERVEVVLPPQEAKRVRAMEHEALARLHSADASEENRR